MKSNIYLLCLLLFLFSSPIGSSKALNYRRKFQSQKEKRTRVETENTKVNPKIKETLDKIKTKVKKVKEKLFSSKIFRFIFGALSGIFHSSGNPVIDSILCIIDSIKLYFELEKEKKANKEATMEDVVLKSKEDASDGKDSDDTKDNTEKDEEDELKKLTIPTEDIKVDLFNDIGMEEKELTDAQTQTDQELASLDNKDSKDKTDDAFKKKHPIKAFFKKLGKKIGKKAVKAKKKIQKKLAQIGQKLKGILGKAKKFFTALFASTAFQALLDFAFCIIPQILSLALGSASLYTSIMSGGLLINIVKAIPENVKSLFDEIKTIINTKKNAEKLSELDQLEKYGESCGKILMLVIKTLFGEEDCPDKGKGKKLRLNYYS